jgi:hypothetical protein
MKSSQRRRSRAFGCFKNVTMRPKTPSQSFRIGTWGILFIFFLVAPSVEGSLAPLLGGSMTWSISNNFENVASSRQVHLTLSAAFEMRPGCSYTAGSAVVCQGSGSCSGNGLCGIAEAHGVLCVAQLKSQADGSFLPKFSHSTAQCLHDLNYLQGTPAALISNVGKVNAFTVISIQNSTNSSSFNRNLARANVVVGKLMHTVRVSEDVSGLLAWFAPRDGKNNLQLENGLLLPQCAASVTEPCAINMKDTSTPPSFGFMRDSSNAPSSPAMLSPSDKYWQGFSARMFDTATWENFRKVSPALETYITLCSVAFCSTRLKNRNSPQSHFPLILEVPVTPESKLRPQSFLSRTGSPFMAPHPPLHFKAWDADGDRMTLYNSLFDDQEMSPETQQNLRAECYLAETLSLSQNGPWPLGVCTSGGQEGRACSSHADCVESTCSPTQSRCREFFNQDDNPFKAEGGMVKFDFSFSTGSGGAFSSVAATTRAFSQHALTILDYPASRQQGQAPLSFPSWRMASTSVQTVFAAFPCDSGDANQPPTFVASLSSTSPKVATEYACTLAHPCEIPLFIRDFAMASNGVGSTEQTSDEVAIEGTVGGEPMTNTSLFREDGQECVGRGALSCIYRLVTPDYVPGQGFSESSAGKVYVRCFAAVDMHNESVAPQRRTCRSMPLCIRIRLDKPASVGGWWPQVLAPVAKLDGSVNALTETVLLSWTVSAPAASDIVSTEVQYAVDDDVVYRPVPITASVTNTDMNLAAADLLASRPEGGRYTFRVIVVTGTGRYHSLRSNSLTLFPPPAPVPGIHCTDVCLCLCLGFRMLTWRCCV